MTCKLHVWVSVGLHIIGGCTLTPSGSFDKHAAQIGLSSSMVHSEHHTHRIFTRHGSDGRGLRIYFGSDGTPFHSGTSAARDPTPRHAMTLELLARDPGPAVYVGRPCYHRMMRNCAPRLWTTGRYSEAVVAAMTEATRAVVEIHPGPEITLVGYSGGGVLALLVADRMAEVTRVVTLAGNLDIDEWTTFHGYLPLGSSINPARMPSWRPDLIQIHFSGVDDHNVPPDIHRRLQRGHPNTTFRQIAGFGHTCCWAEQWPALLDEALATSPFTGQGP